MALQASIPQLINKTFAGNAAADIDQRATRQAQAVADSLESKLRAEIDAKLAKKVDITAFEDYTNSAPAGGTGSPAGGAAANVVDNGDGTATIS